MLETKQGEREACAVVLCGQQESLVAVQTEWETLLACELPESEALPG